MRLADCRQADSGGGSAIVQNVPPAAAGIAKVAVPESITDMRGSRGLAWSSRNDFQDSLGLPKSFEFQTSLEEAALQQRARLRLPPLQRQCSIPLECWAISCRGASSSCQ